MQVTTTIEIDHLPYRDAYTYAVFKVTEHGETRIIIRDVPMSYGKVERDFIRDGILMHLKNSYGDSSEFLVYADCVSF